MSKISSSLEISASPGQQMQCKRPEDFDLYLTGIKMEENAKLSNMKRIKVTKTSPMMPECLSLAELRETRLLPQKTSVTDPGTWYLFKFKRGRLCQKPRMASIARLPTSGNDASLQLTLNIRWHSKSKLDV